MIIEAVDFFYLKMPVVTNEADGSQDMLLVRVQSENGFGWGECEASPVPTIAAWCAPKSHGACRPVCESVLGERLQGPDDIYRINAKVRTNSLDLLQADHTLSGIDMALWDLLARQRGLPVYRLLGAETVFAKTPYASVLFGDTPEATFQKAKQIKERGFRAAKFGWNRFGLGTASEDREFLAAARQGLGDDAYLMVDAGTVWGDSVESARARLAALHEFKATWLEEPFHSVAVQAYSELARHEHCVPLAGGEGAHNVHLAKLMIDYAAIDYVQIDTGRIGGISTSREVALYAQNRGVRYVNHTFTSMLALSASLAPYWDLKDSFICEYPVEPKPLCVEISQDRMDLNSDGAITPREAPGLGIVPDPAAMRKYLVDLKIVLDDQVIYETPKIDW